MQSKHVEDTNEVVLEFEMGIDLIEYLESESKKKHLTVSELVDDILVSYIKNNLTGACSDNLDNNLK